jgi:hypothetical protein
MNVSSGNAYHRYRREGFVRGEIQTGGRKKCCTRKVMPERMPERNEHDRVGLKMRRMGVA